MAGWSSRTEGGESERRGPGMPRRVPAPVVLLFAMIIYCTPGEAVQPDGSSSVNEELPQGVDIFVPGTTQVVPKGGAGEVTRRSFFRVPSFARAGEVIAAFAEASATYYPPVEGRSSVFYSDVIAGYINAAEKWSSLVAEVNKNTWRAHSVVGASPTADRVGVAVNPATIGKGTKVFLLVENYNMTFDTSVGHWTRGNTDIQLVVGEATQSKEGSQGELIEWGEPVSLLTQITRQTQGSGITGFGIAGGSGVLMEDGTLVFPLKAKNKDGNDPVFMILYSTDDGASWVPSERMPLAGCYSVAIAEWEKGQLLVVTGCSDGQEVYESRDMGKTWAGAPRTLSGVWVNPESGAPLDLSLHVDALITATIGENRVMLYTQNKYSPGEAKATALYLWVTDNNRTFHLGPLSVDSSVGETYTNALLYAGDALHLLQRRPTAQGRPIFLVPLTEQLETIKSVLQTWAQRDASLSMSSVPTSGLVGFLSNAASDDTWIDEYLCVNATVTSAKKVENGFEFTGPGSRAMWPVNSRENNNQYGFLSYGFALVATVVVHQVPRDSTPLMGAILGDGKGTTVVGLSYNAESKWETVFNGTKTTQSSTTWEPGKEYQVALMLQEGSKGSVYVDGQQVGSSETLPTIVTREHGISDFYFGGGGDQEGHRSNVTMTNVFLYNRPLAASELRMMKKSDSSTSGSASEEGSGSDSSVSLGVSRLLLLSLWLCALSVVYDV